MQEECHMATEATEIAGCQVLLEIHWKLGSGKEGFPIDFRGSMTFHTLVSHFYPPEL
jgi:hypothetical protein